MTAPFGFYRRYAVDRPKVTLWAISGLAEVSPDNQPLSGSQCQLPALAHPKQGWLSILALQGPKGQYAFPSTLSLLNGCLLPFSSPSLPGYKHNFWQDWHEKSPQNKEQGIPVPPSPEQMLQDKNTAHLNVSEVRSMLQELLDSTMFNKGEVKAIRYMSAVVENLNKALTLQHKENKSLETKYKYLQVEKNKELSTQRLHFQKSIQVLESKRDALLKQVKILGDKYHHLLKLKVTLGYSVRLCQGSY